MDVYGKCGRCGLNALPHPTVASQLCSHHILAPPSLFSASNRMEHGEWIQAVLLASRVSDIAKAKLDKQRATQPEPPPPAEEKAPPPALSLNITPPASPRAVSPSAPKATPPRAPEVSTSLSMWRVIVGRGALVV
jgi:hypothetical protein